ncbi:hypothetical protein MML48_3g00012991 [Holotrichia oblita]|uniref:Uncharacterized protein n=1 Tax=Holotrichia oblita TaxID=644536 RepID=A0ACB9TI57_HOLOL|nr:hypothetical protein MML48_3g00012991 [Holotrichia oblita]
MQQQETCDDEPAPPADCYQPSYSYSGSPLTVSPLGSLKRSSHDVNATAQQLADNIFRTNSSLDTASKYKCTITSERLAQLKKVVEDAVKDHKIFTIKGPFPPLLRPGFPRSFQQFRRGFPFDRVHRHTEAFHPQDGDAGRVRHPEHRREDTVHRVAVRHEPHRRVHRQQEAHGHRQGLPEDLGPRMGPVPHALLPFRPPGRAVPRDEGLVVERAARRRQGHVDGGGEILAAIPSRRHEEHLDHEAGEQVQREGYTVGEEYRGCRQSYEFEVEIRRSEIYRNASKSDREHAGLPGDDGSASEHVRAVRGRFHPGRGFHALAARDQFQSGSIAVDERDGQDVPAMMVDRRKDPKSDTGLFEMIYKQNLPRAPAYLGMSLSVRGRRVFKNRSKRNGGVGKGLAKDEQQKVSGDRKENSNLKAPAPIVQPCYTPKEISADMYEGPIIGDLMEEIQNSYLTYCENGIDIVPMSPQHVKLKKKIALNGKPDHRVSKSDHRGRRTTYNNKKRSSSVRRKSKGSEKINKAAAAAVTAGGDGSTKVADESSAQQQQNSAFVKQAPVAIGGVRNKFYCGGGGGTGNRIAWESRRRPEPEDTSASILHHNRGKSILFKFSPSVNKNYPKTNDEHFSLMADAGCYLQANALRVLAFEAKQRNC